MSGSRIVGALRTSVALQIKDKGRVNRMQILPTSGRLAWRREAEGEGTVFAELGSLCAGDCAFLSTPTGRVDRWGFAEAVSSPGESSLPGAHNTLMAFCLTLVIYKALLR